MATDNEDNRLSIGNGDYTELLRQAVAVIEHARTEIAKHVNGYLSTAYWEIGQMLHERKIESSNYISSIRCSFQPSNCMMMRCSWVPWRSASTLGAAA